MSGTFQSRPSFLLWGSGYVYNYGCEAIVRGTVKVLRERWPNSRIRYASLGPADDARRLQGCSVDVNPRIALPWRLQQHPRWSAWSVMQKARARFGLRILPACERMDYLSDSDVVLSIGGDLYTPPHNGRGYPRGLLEYGDAVLERRKKLVLWGASVGPFPSGSPGEKALAAHLRRTSLIASRESESTQYLERIGVTENVVECADPAFALASPPEAAAVPGERRLIGVNLSPLSLRYSGSQPDLAVAARAHAEVLTQIAEVNGADLALIPHVACGFSERDDDVRYLRRVYDALPRVVRQRTAPCPDDLGFEHTKALLRSCRLVVAARMHCAINALSECVPTVLLAYSQKAYGLAGYAYGNTRWVLSLPDFQAGPAARLVKEALDEEQLTRIWLRRRLPAITADVRLAVRALENLVGQLQ